MGCVKTASIRRCCQLVLLAALAACAPPPPATLPTPTEGAALPAEFPAAYYRQAAAEGRKVLQVVPERSLVAIEVHRAGSMARLGHDHVVASHDLRGYVAPQESRADIYVPLAALVVDEPDLRAEARFDTQPSAAAIEGTRRNMLDKVLEAERFPFALIHVARDPASPSRLKLSITLHGTTRDMEIPAEFENLPDGMVVSGRLGLKQTDFGIVPMSVLGGAIQVANGVDLRFHIVAVEARAH